RNAAELDRSNCHWVAVQIELLHTQVSDLDRLPGHGGTGNDESRGRTEHSSGPPRCRVCRWHRAVDRSQADRVSFAEKQIAVVSLAKARRVRENGLEHGLQVTWRAADDAEDLGGRRLALQRFAQLAGGGLQLAGGRRLLLQCPTKLAGGGRLLSHRLVELAGQQRDLLLVA